jgi:hypothetical protein
MNQQKCQCTLCVEKKGEEGATIFPSVSVGKTHVCAVHHKKPSDARNYLKILTQEEKETVTTLG